MQLIGLPLCRCKLLLLPLYVEKYGRRNFYVMAVLNRWGLTDFL